LLDARDLRRKLRFRRSCSMSGSPERNPSVFSRIRRDRSESPLHRPEGRRNGGVFNRLGGKERVCPRTRKAATTVTIQEEWIPLQKNVTMRGHHHVIQKHSPKAKIAGMDTGSQGRRRQSQALKKMSYLNHSDDPEDHLKFFQAAVKVERWAMTTWCHMFNSTRTGSARIKQREGESMEDFVQRFKVESRHVKRAPECMRISKFMYVITNPKLIKRLHDNISKSVDKMMRVITTFLRGEVAASDQAWKKTLPAWRQQEAGRKQNLDRRGDFRNQHRSERRRDKFTLLTKSPKEILALDKGKFKAPPPMTTPVEKQNNNKFCKFHREVRHNTDECIHLRRQIKELIKSGKLSHVIKELKQGSGKDQPKATKKGEISGKDKPLAILMVQPWKRVARQRITQSFSPDPEISFPPLGEEDETEGPMIIEAEIEGHFIHRIYVDGGSASEILYEHCFNRLRPEVCRTFNLHMDEFCGGDITISVQWDHRKTGGKEIQAVPSTAHGMLKFPIPGGIFTLRSSRIIPLECMMVFGSEAQTSNVI
ncbi:hypothetical protein Tco_0976343, partial [Tanacetum coccineum]